MSSPQRRDRSPRGRVSLPKAPTKKQLKEKKIELYTPVVKPENPRNDVQEARLLSMELVKASFPLEAVRFSFPCGNRFCDACESDHQQRLTILGESEL